jgi:hypothetical protein
MLWRENQCGLQYSRWDNEHFICWELASVAVRFHRNVNDSMNICSSGRKNKKKTLSLFTAMCLIDRKVTCNILWIENSSKQLLYDQETFLYIPLRTWNNTAQICLHILVHRPIYVFAKNLSKIYLYSHLSSHQTTQLLNYLHTLSISFRIFAFLSVHLAYIRAHAIIHTHVGSNMQILKSKLFSHGY